MPAISENTTNLRIRKLEPWVIQTHNQIAGNIGLSLEEHLRKVLTQGALQAQEDFADEIDQYRADIKKKYGDKLPKAESLIRAVREES